MESGVLNPIKWVKPSVCTFISVFCGRSRFIHETKSLNPVKCCEVAVQIFLCFSESESESESEEVKCLGPSRLHQLRPKTRVTRSHRSKNRKRGEVSACSESALSFDLWLKMVTGGLLFL